MSQTPTKRRRTESEPSAPPPDAPELDCKWCFSVSGNVFSDFVRALGEVTDSISLLMGDSTGYRAGQEQPSHTGEYYNVASPRLFVPWGVDPRSNVGYRGSLQLLSLKVSNDCSEEEGSVVFSKELLVGGLKMLSGADSLVVSRQILPGRGVASRVTITACNKDSRTDISVPLLDSVPDVGSPPEFPVKYQVNILCSDFKRFAAHVSSDKGNNVATFKLETGKPNAQGYQTAVFTLTNEEHDSNRATFTNRLHTAFATKEDGILVSNTGVTRGMELDRSNLECVYSGVYYVKEVYKIASQTSANILTLSILRDDDKGVMMCDIPIGHSEETADVSGITLMLVASCQDPTEP